MSNKTFFDIGETVICSLQVNRAGVAFASADSAKITIYDPDGAAVTGSDNADMNDTGGGLYQHDFATAGKDNGVYRVIVTVTYGTRITIRRAMFRLKT